MSDPNELLETGTASSEDAPRKKRGLFGFLWGALRILTLIAVLAFVPTLLWYKFSTDDFARYWFVIVAPIMGIILLALWYLIFGKPRFGRRAKHFGIFLLVFVVLGISFFQLFRYEGSTSGTSAPKFAWRFSNPEGKAGSADTPSAQQETSPLPTEAAEGAMDSLQFLGANRDGVILNSNASMDWTANPPKELWRQPIGEGWSSFSVSGNLAVTQEQRGDDELVTCYHLTTGKLIWAHTDPNTRFTKVVVEEDEKKRVEAVMGGEGPRATPTILGDKVYAYTSIGILNCLNLNDGSLVWSKNVLEDFDAGLPKWGKSTSPLIVADSNLVVVSAAEKVSKDSEAPTQPTLVAYSLDAGELVWEYAGNGASYSSPPDHDSSRRHSNCQHKRRRRYR